MSAESIYLWQSARLAGKALEHGGAFPAPSLSDTLQCRCTGAIKRASNPHLHPTSALNFDKTLSESCIVPLHYCFRNDSWFNADGKTKEGAEKTAAPLFKTDTGNTYYRRTVPGNAGEPHAAGESSEASA